MHQQQSVARLAFHPKTVTSALSIATAAILHILFRFCVVLLQHDVTTMGKDSGLKMFTYQWRYHAEKCLDLCPLTLVTGVQCRSDTSWQTDGGALFTVGPDRAVACMHAIAASSCFGFERTGILSLP